jgi:hypothetical protein
VLGGECWGWRGAERGRRAYLEAKVFRTYIQRLNHPRCGGEEDRGPGMCCRSAEQTTRGLRGEGFKVGQERLSISQGVPYVQRLDHPRCGAQEDVGPVLS